MTNSVDDKSSISVSGDDEEGEQTASILSESKILKGFVSARRAARLIIVQTLYRLSIVGGDVDIALSQAHDLPFFDDEQNDISIVCKRIDWGLVDYVVRGVQREGQVLEALVGNILSETWPLSNLSAVMKCLLKAASFELLYMPDSPPKIVLHEYVTLTGAFENNRGCALINSVLDIIARDHNLLD